MTGILEQLGRNRIVAVLLRAPDADRLHGPPHAL